MKADKASPPAWQGMFHGTGQMSELRVGSWSWSWQGMPRAGSQGWQSCAVPPCPTCVPPCCPPGCRDSLPAALGKGFYPLPADVGQTDRQHLPKAQPSWSLEPALSLGSSLEAPLGIPWLRAGVGGGSVALGPWLMRVRVSGKWLRSHLAPVFFSPGGAAVPWLCPGCAMQGQQRG